jgi:hypothetical protein
LRVQEPNEVGISHQECRSGDRIEREEATACCQAVASLSFQSFDWTWLTIGGHARQQ